jgi:hypothetical protein
MRRYICFYQSIGEKNAVNGMDLLVVVLVVMLVLVVVMMLLMPLVMVLAIFGFRKELKGLVFAATAKSPGAFPRIS